VMLYYRLSFVVWDGMFVLEMFAACLFEFVGFLVAFLFRNVKEPIELQLFYFERYYTTDEARLFLSVFWGIGIKIYYIYIYYIYIYIKIKIGVLSVSISFRSFPLPAMGLVVSCYDELLDLHWHRSAAIMGQHFCCDTGTVD
jgi:hypothetical protein